MEKTAMAFAGLVIMAIVLMNASPSLGGCGELGQLVPCASFVLGPGTGKPTEACCTGIKTVVKGADTTEKRRALCQCLKDAAAGAGVKIDPEKIKALLKGCDVTLPFPIKPDVDCSKISLF